MPTDPGQGGFNTDPFNQGGGPPLGFPYLPDREIVVYLPVDEFGSTDPSFSVPLALDEFADVDPNLTVLI